MPRLLIHKEGENPTLESPDMSEQQCAAQQAQVESVISVRHREDGVEQGRDQVVELGWASVAAHVIQAVEIEDEGEDV